VDVLRQYEDRIAYWKSEPDKGVYDAWNKALAEAHGEWVCFLGVDDEFLPGAVSAYMALAAKNPEAEYLSSRVKWAHPSGYVRTIGSPWTWNRFRKMMCTAHVGSMHRRSLYDRLGSYDTSYCSAADYELLLRARDQLKAAFMPTTTVIMRLGRERRHQRACRGKTCKNYRRRPKSTARATRLQIAKAKFALRPFRRALGR